MNASTITPEIAAFATAVRAALSDLPADERDELTDGLEADLAEAYAEDLRRELPDPGEYAAELRTAAGLPVQESKRRGFSEAWRGSVRDVRSAIDRHPALSATADFLKTLRPAWWVARGWAATYVVAQVFGGWWGLLPGLPWFLVAIAAIVLSVQIGRGRWTFRWLTPLVVVGNVVAAIALVVMIDHSANGGYVYGSSFDEGYQQGMLDSGTQDLTGVYLDGQAVTNIFPYDASGKPLKDVQLYSENGRRLSTAVAGGNGCLDESTCDEYGLWVSRALTSGLAVFNVYPLQMVQTETDEMGADVPVEGAEPIDKPLPFPLAPAVVGAESDTQDGAKADPKSESKVSPDND